MVGDREGKGNVKRRAGRGVVVEEGRGMSTN
jgi:hypothetical protein